MHDMFWLGTLLCTTVLVMHIVTYSFVAYATFFRYAQRRHNLFGYAFYAYYAN